MMQSPSFKIAIVGMGSRGLYGFERILAQLKANAVKRRVEIHLFNKTRFMGSGDVYRSDQPGYMLMNFSNKHINMWSGESPPPVIQHPLSFSEYIAQEKQTHLEEIHTNTGLSKGNGNIHPHKRHHVNHLTKISSDKIAPFYAARSTVGRYLENGFAQLTQNLPENVILEQHIAEVRSIEKMNEGYSIGFMQEGQTCWLTNFRHILITTGHQRHIETTRSNHRAVPFIYPVQKQLNGVTERDTVAVKGMGLTFIDAALALTEGKGGSFTETIDGELIYKASGREPKRIYPFSKSGWPMLPKYDFDLNNDNELYVKRLKLLRHKKLNLKYEILPLIEKDMEYAYYRTLFSHEREMLEYHPDYDVINRQIDTFHQKHPEYARFSLDKLLEPEFNSSKCNHQNILEYLTAFTNENNRNIEHEAQLRAASVWRKITPIFNEIYSFSGLDANSHQEFDGFYFGKINRIAYGPPSVNLKKILALANLKIVDLQFARKPHIEPHKNGVLLKNGVSEIYCDLLIDASIPKNSIKKEASGLFTNLCKNKLARPYINSNGKFSYEPGTLQINRNGKLINPQGTTENITLYGTPTVGIVHDNDTLSRTRNNFAAPWASTVIGQLINSKNEINKQTANTFACTE